MRVLSEKLEKTIYGEPEANLPGYSQVLQGVGGAGSFIAGGAFGQTLKAPAWLTTLGMGSSMGATNQYDEAAAMGGDANERALALAGGAAIGSTEAIPGAFFLNRLNRLTGGKVMDKIKDFGLNGDTTPLREAIKAALIEGGQEGLQNTGENWVASDLAGYDPDSPRSTRQTAVRELLRKLESR